MFRLGQKSFSSYFKGWNSSWSLSSLLRHRDISSGSAVWTNLRWNQVMQKLKENENQFRVSQTLSRIYCHKRFYSVHTQNYNYINEKCTLACFVNHNHLEAGQMCNLHSVWIWMSKSASLLLKKARAEITGVLISSGLYSLFFAPFLVTAATARLSVLQMLRGSLCHV